MADTSDIRPDPDDPDVAGVGAHQAPQVDVDDYEHLRAGHAVDANVDDERARVRTIVEWVSVIVGALVVALVVKTFLFQAFYIPSVSMEPTLGVGERVLVNKLSYDVHDVNRGDVVVFHLSPEEVGPDGIKDLIKRVIALPGEVVESRDGVVYVDDRRLIEPYLPDDGAPGPEIERQTVPEGHVFVMGDNRDNSADSRVRGPIAIDDIVGRAFLAVWPPTEIGSL